LILGERVDQVFSLVAIETLHGCAVVIVSHNVDFVEAVLGFGSLVDFESFFGFLLEFFNQTFAAKVAYFLPSFCKVFLAEVRFSSFFEHVVEGVLSNVTVDVDFVGEVKVSPETLFENNDDPNT